MFDPLNPPNCLLVSLWAICFAYINSQMNLQMCTKCGANRTSRLNIPLTFGICDPLTPPPPMSRGELYLAYVHYQMNPETCTKFVCQSVQPFDSLPDFWICDPLKPPEMTPCVLRFNLFGIFPFPDESAMCAKFGANRPSRLIAFPEFV